MGFRVKSFREILGSMSDWVTSYSSRLTNFYVGSVVRTLLESVAVEIESLYFKAYFAFSTAIEGAIFTSFGFGRNAAVPASGQVKVTFTFPLIQPLLVPKGYRFSTTPINGVAMFYDVATDTIVPEGSTETLLTVQCVIPGMLGNVAPDQIKIALVRIPIIASITNPSAFINGVGEESTDELKKRFSKYIDTLARGTANAIEYGCLSVSGVAGAYVKEGVGIVDVWAHDSSGNLPNTLKASIETALIDYRAAGIPVTVHPITKVMADVTVDVQLNAGFDIATYTALINGAIYVFLNNFPAAKSLTRSELIKFIMLINENAIVNCTLAVPAQDMVVQDIELVRPGLINVVAHY